MRRLNHQDTASGVREAAEPAGRHGPGCAHLRVSSRAIAGRAAGWPAAASPPALAAVRLVDTCGNDPLSLNVGQPETGFDEPRKKWARSRERLRCTRFPRKRSYAPWGRASPRARSGRCARPFRAAAVGVTAAGAGTARTSPASPELRLAEEQPLGLEASRARLGGRVEQALSSRDPMIPECGVAAPKSALTVPRNLPKSHRQENCNPTGSAEIYAFPKEMGAPAIQGRLP